jgi:hypothetical protein
VIARDAADVRPNALFNVRPNEFDSVLRAEDYVIEQSAVRICHVVLTSSSIQASLTRRGLLLPDLRGLKPTAKVSRRYRGEETHNALSFI